MTNFSKISVIVLVAIVLFVAYTYFDSDLNEFEEIGESARDGVLYAWGKSASGQLGNNNTSAPFGPIQIQEFQHVKKLAAGMTHSFVLMDDGTVYGWGSNYEGELGVEEAQLTQSPKLLGTLTNVMDFSTRQDHTLILKNDGTVWAFGYNYNGQIGDGTREARFLPYKVEEITHAKGVATGYRFSLALLDDGTVWGWGGTCSDEDKIVFEAIRKEFESSVTELGGYLDPSSEDFGDRKRETDCYGEEFIGINSLTPHKIEGLESVKELSAGYGHVLALMEDGTVRSFGCNLFGQLGRGDNLSQIETSMPNEVRELQNIISVSAGFRHSLALERDGTVFSWGENTHGQLGDGTETSRSAPVKVLGLPPIQSISAGHDFSLALDHNGHLWVWGENEYGEHGREEPDEAIQPVRIDGLENVIMATAGGNHALALTRDSK